MASQKARRGSGSVERIITLNVGGGPEGGHSHLPESTYAALNAGGVVRYSGSIPRGRIHGVKDSFAVQE